MPEVKTLQVNYPTIFSFTFLNLIYYEIQSFPRKSYPKIKLNNEQSLVIFATKVHSKYYSYYINSAL